MTEHDAMALMYYLRAKGYVVHAEFTEDRWRVIATKLRSRP